VRGRPLVKDDPLPVVQVAAIEQSDGPAWLVEGLWAEEGVGIVGGAPKCCKSWLALDLALSVASGTPALGIYPVPRAGPVLVFAAEDPPTTVRSRLEGLTVRRGLALERVPLHVILSSSLRLDMPGDQARLSEAVGRYRPRLLVLDPFVRLHRIDENSALEVSGVLAYLRELQRQQHLAVLVVHHARKAGAGAEQAGVSLRGSGDFHAWGDSNLYMRRRRGALELAIEHRSAASPEPVQLALENGDGGPPRLTVVAASTASLSTDDFKGRVVAALLELAAPTTQEALRSKLGVRLARLVTALRELEHEGRIRRTPAGFSASTLPGETELSSAETQLSKG
jgi:hypothetical protein